MSKVTIVPHTPAHPRVFRFGAVTVAPPRTPTKTPSSHGGSYLSKMTLTAISW